MMKILKVGAAVMYLFFLFYIVFFARRREALQDTRRRELINVVPIIHQVHTYRGLAPHDEKGKRNFVLNLAGNIFLFLPLPFLVYSFGVKRPKKILGVALLLTAGIEATQLAFHIGVPDVDDVLLNMAGAVLGVLLLKQIPVPARAAMSRI